jgi:predicted nucleic acid-binding protein
VNVARPVVLYDACVLYPFYLRDLLVRIGMTDLVQAKWTDEIHDEWIRNLSRNEGIPVEQLTRTRRLMDGAVLDCLVAGYQPRIPKLTLPDPNDRHVLAAAIECAADVIVTKNLDDFPQAYLNQFGVEATHPDEFVLAVLDDEPGPVVQALREQRAAYRDPALSVEEFVAALENCELEDTADALRQRYLDQL